MSGSEYLIDASAYWRIDRGAVLAVAWRDHLERGLVWICPPTEMEICRRASKDQHAVHLREFRETYVRVEWHHRAGATAREIQADLIDCGQAAGVHPVDLLVAATALGDGFAVLTDDGDMIIRSAQSVPGCTFAWLATGQAERLDRVGCARSHSLGRVSLASRSRCLISTGACRSWTPPTGRCGLVPVRADQ